MNYRMTYQEAITAIHNALNDLSIPDSEPLIMLDDSLTLIRHYLNAQSLTHAVDEQKGKVVWLAWPDNRRIFCLYLATGEHSYILAYPEEVSESDKLEDALANKQ